MMTGVADLLQALLETTLATTAAVLLVLALRLRLRAAFGATVAYAAWALVPVAAIAMLLPAATRPVLAMPMAQVLVVAPTATPLAVAASPVDWPLWTGMAWLLGALFAVLWFAREQRGFRRGLGTLRRRDDGLQQAQAVDGLPAAIGLWKPAIVLPADFDARYSNEQRALMVAHERMHIVRGDLHANALTAAMRCVFWFNPLLHVAARQFRHDQELACDLRVIARHPHARRAYGEAMFKTQLALHPSALGCHWGSHPLKERIAMLKQPVPSLKRRTGGAVLVGVLALGAGFAAWSAQPARVVASQDVPLPPPPPAPPMPPAPPAPPALAPLAPLGVAAIPAAAPAPPPAAPAIPAVAPAPPAPPVRGIPGVAPAPPAPSPALPAPAYPKEALAQNVSGKVVLEIDVDAKGNPLAVTVVESEPAGVFDASAVAAAKEWKFNPVPGRIRVPIRFEATPINETRKLPMGPKGNPDAAAYDWIKIDQALATDIREQNCDVIYAQAQGGDNYCGRIRKSARQG
jgi:TonB family protein